MKTNDRPVFWLFTAAAACMVAVLLVSCRPAQDVTETDSDAGEAPTDLVAEIGDYAITKDELKQRLAQEIRPQREEYGLSREPVTPEAVLRKMVAEKAMAMEGRKLGYLEDEVQKASVERYTQKLLINLFVTDYVMENVPVTEPEIDEQLQADPNLTREQAQMKVRSAKANPMLKEFYTQLLEKFKLEKVKENFAKASKIHQRLLSRPAQPRGGNVFWITNKQIREELTPDEKSIVLARYTAGEFTLHDWFKALSSMAPPGRPKDLGRPEGVEKLLDRAIPPVIWAAEAVDRGYDKNEELLEKVRAREDMQLLGKVRSEKYKEVAEPSDEEIQDYFEAHQEQFANPASLKVEQVWCADRPTAEKAREMFADGASLESVNAAHGLLEQSRPHNVYPASEGLFWDDLWAAEPNDVVGPLKGFYQTGIKWRVARVLEKTPPVPRPYSDALKNQVKSALMTSRRQDIMALYEAQLLENYPHDIYADRIEDMDPLEVTPPEEPAR